MTLKRGVEYFKDGRVEDLQVFDDGVHAIVWGNHAYVVSILHSVHDDTLVSECSCPVGFACKHAVATLLMYSAYQDAEGGFDDAPNRIEDWAADMQHEVTALQLFRHVSKAEQLEKTDSILVYVLGKNWMYDGGLTSVYGDVHRRQSRRLKRGGLGKPKSRYELDRWGDIGSLVQYGGERSDIDIAAYLATRAESGFDHHFGQLVSGS